MSVNECKSKKGENDCERKRKNFELFTFNARKRNTVRMRVCQKARAPFRGTRACAYDRTHVTCKCINAWWNSGLYRFSGVKEETKDMKNVHGGNTRSIRGNESAYIYRRHEAMSERGKERDLYIQTHDFYYKNVGYNEVYCGK